MTSTTASTTIDVRAIAPNQRHVTIFAAFRALDAGDALEIVSDHDPKPLYLQFEAQMPGDFSWHSLQSGPDVWRVNVRKPARSHAAGGCCGACGGGGS